MKSKLYLHSSHNVSPSVSTTAPHAPHVCGYNELTTEYFIFLKILDNLSILHLNYPVRLFGKSHIMSDDNHCQSELFTEIKK